MYRIFTTFLMNIIIECSSDCNRQRLSWARARWIGMREVREKDHMVSKMIIHVAYDGTSG